MVQASQESGTPVCLVRQLALIGDSYEDKLENFVAFVKLGCIIILLRRYL